MGYTGRFAPSPTGPLHFGSLVAAVGSYLDARANRGRWLLRIEDLDAPRTVPGTADAMLRCLDACGLQWDGPVLYQSSRLEAYREALARLEKQGMAYGCACSRREIADSALLGIDGPVYPGTCRDGLPAGRPTRAVRLRTGGARIDWTDAIQGEMTQDIEHQVGDFVVARADGMIAYQLAVVIDDGAQGVTDVVRGADLLDSTARQIWLQRQLGLPQPHYVHLPVAVNAQGEKLSKQTHAIAIDSAHPVPAWLAVLRFLGQAPPPALETAGVTAIHDWAVAHWQRKRVPRQRIQAA